MTTVALLPGVARAEPSLGELRAQRAVLLRRIAALTDETTRMQAQADVARRRRELADFVVEQVRQRVARYAVETYVAGSIESQVVQQRRGVYSSVASRTDRAIFEEIDRARAAADAEGDRADVALANAQRVAADLRSARDMLEHTITQRVQASVAGAAARRAAMTPAITTHPAFARTTHSQAELFGRYPFGPVGGIPDGLVATGRVITGKASWYGPGFDGRPTASGAIFDQEGWTVASRDLPLGTMLYITHGGRGVLALVNDRGPFVASRVLDLSHGVANALGTLQSGVAVVTATVVAPA